MHFVTCKIALNEDRLTVVPRDEFNPVSWPELEVIRYLHGESSVLDAKPFVSVNQAAKDEKERLRIMYGTEVVENIFPGRNPSMELDAPGAKNFIKIPWKNPITGDMVHLDSSPAKDS